MIQVDEAGAVRPAGGFARRLGPGLITGAADDDPSGIATYSQVGAQFGYRLAWTMLFSLPLMIVIQEISGRIGCVTGQGIAWNLRRHYPSWVVRAIVVLLLVANTINLGADLGAMGAAVKLLIGGSSRLYTIGFGILCVLDEVFLTYAVYASVLKWLTVSLFAYVAVVFAVHVPWSQALSATVMPSLKFDRAEISGARRRSLGRRSSPYLFFWQAALEAEDSRKLGGEPLRSTPAKAPASFAPHPARHDHRHGRLERRRNRPSSSPPPRTPARERRHPISRRRRRRRKR